MIRAVGSPRRARTVWTVPAQWSSSPAPTSRRARNQGARVTLRHRATAPPAGQYKPGPGDVVAFALDKVRGEIAGRPRREESRCLGTEFVEQVAELCSLDGVEERIGHIAGV